MKRLGFYEGPVRFMSERDIRRSQWEFKNNYMRRSQDTALLFTAACLSAVFMCFVPSIITLVVPVCFFVAAVLRYPGDFDTAEALEEI